MTFLLWIAVVALVVMLIMALVAVIGEADVEDLLPRLSVMRVLGLTCLLAVAGQVTLTVTTGILSAVHS